MLQIKPHRKVRQGQVQAPRLEAGTPCSQASRGPSGGWLVGGISTVLQIPSVQCPLLRPQHLPDTSMRLLRPPGAWGSLGLSPPPPNMTGAVCICEHLRLVPDKKATSVPKVETPGLLPVQHLHLSFSRKATL